MTLAAACSTEKSLESPSRHCISVEGLVSGLRDGSSRGRTRYGANRTGDYKTCLPHAMWKHRDAFTVWYIVHHWRGKEMASPRLGGSGGIA
jgi:hypothetical protein